MSLSKLLTCRRSEECVQAVREPGGFQPVGQQVQFQGGEADGGLAGECELFRAGLGHKRSAVTQQWLDIF